MVGVRVRVGRAFLIIAIVACLGTGISSKQHIIQNRRRSQVHGMNDVLIWVIDGGPSLQWGVREYVCCRSVVLDEWANHVTAGVAGALMGDLRLMNG